MFLLETLRALFSDRYLDKIVKERDALKQQLESAKEQISSLKSEYKTKLAGERADCCCWCHCEVAILVTAEQRRAANSRTVPSQQDISHQPLTMPATAASQSTPTAAQRKHHHQQHSAHQRREKTSRLKPEDSRSLAFIPISQHHSPTHSTPRTMHAHHSPKRSARYPMGPHGAGEGRMVSSGEAYHSHTHLYPGRRRSNEDSPEVWKHITEQRRKSADSTVPQEQLPRARGRKGEQPQRFLSQHVSAGRRREGPRLRDSSSSEDLETGCSQQGRDEGVVNPTDITITLQDDEGERVRSDTSSNSTLIDSSSPPRDMRSPSSQHKPLSQELFGDDDHKDMMSLSAVGPAQIPLSNFPQLYYEPSGYFGDYQEHYAAPPPPILSQPTYPSPPKSRHGKSLTDLTGSNVSLTSSQQFLSVSAVDIQNMQDLHHSSRQPTESRRGATQDTRYRGSRGQLHRMSSDSHLNKSYTPGLQKSIIYALSEVKEEVEQKKHQTRETATSSSHAHSSSPSQQQQRGSRHTTQSQHTPRKGSQLQQTHLQATKVKGGSSMQERKVTSAVKK